MALTEAQVDQLKEDMDEVLRLRIKPANGSYAELGQKVVEWAMNPGSRPQLEVDGSVRDVSEFKASIDHLFTNLPAHITRVVFVQPTDLSEYIIRLPPLELVTKSHSVMERAKQLAPAQRDRINFKYPDPVFYVDRLLSGNTDPDDHEYLKSRIGDYTFSGCA